jgi:DNA-binding transcriptional MerR regulator
MSLRQLGFSLEEIRECLENATAFSLRQVIDLHQTRLREQITLLNTQLNQLNVIARELQTTQSIAVEHLIQTMETITMSEQYFTLEQQAVLETRLREGETEWQVFLTQIRTEMNNGRDLNSLPVQALARRFRSMVQTWIGGDRQVYESLVKTYQQLGVEAASFDTLDSATFEYILKAVSFLSLAEEMKLAVSFNNFTSEAIQVVILGQEAVRHLNLNYIGTEGILLGLLAEENGIAAKVLVSAGVNFQAVQHLIKQWSRSSVVSPNEIPDELPYSPKAFRVLELALDEIKLLDQAQVSTGHLLLGILKQGQEAEGAGWAIRSLKELLRVDLTDLEQQLRSAIAQ